MAAQQLYDSTIYTSNNC